VGKIRGLFLACALLVSSCTSPEKGAEDVDFDESFGKKSIDWQSIVSHPGNRERITLVKKVYEKNSPSKVLNASSGKIPKILHHIWLGPKSPPSYFSEYKKSWEKNHPGWKFRLWKDKDVEDFDFELKDLYMRSTNWGEKSDILRAEILDRYGGMYADVDIECIKSFDSFVEKYDFFAGLEPPHQGDFTTEAPHIVISNALIGARTGHPIIKAWKQEIRARWDEVEKKLPDCAKRVLLRTFYPFGDAVSKNLINEKNTNIVLPPTYFFPLTFTEVSKGKLKKLPFFKRHFRSLMRAIKKKEEMPFVEIKPETMAVHYWGNSWVKSHEERIKEMYRHLCHFEDRTEQKLFELQEQIRELQAKVVKQEVQKIDKV